MAHAYIPGLKVTASTIVNKERRLPLKGQVVVEVGQQVIAADIVARTELPGAVFSVNVPNILGILPEDTTEMMVEEVGAKVDRGQVIAEKRSFFGLFKSVCRSPMNGSIELVSDNTGQVMIREAPLPVEVNAYVDGEVTEIIADEGVIVRTRATFIQGIFGIGGETTGTLMLRATDRDQVLDAPDFDESCKNNIVVGGGLITLAGLEKAIAVGARAVVVGGIHDWDLKAFLGYDLGVAITGSEKKGITLVVTEGFGKMPMAPRTFALLQEREGMKTSVNGTTQIRAGVLRPEVVIPLDESVADTGAEADARLSTGITVGSPVRCIREPYFGRIGIVKELPEQLQQLPTEAKVRVLSVEFDGEDVVTVPRANVEGIER